MDASRALSHSFPTGASGFTKSGPTMVHPVVKKVTATRPYTDRLKKPLRPFPEDVLLNDFDGITKTSLQCLSCLLSVYSSQIF
jgi:hypothetical protein